MSLRAQLLDIERCCTLDRDRKALRQAADRLGWVSVDKRLPEPGAYVLTFSEIAGFTLEVMTDTGWHGGDHDNITHWMPLPESPAHTGE